MTPQEVRDSFFRDEEHVLRLLKTQGFIHLLAPCAGEKLYGTRDPSFRKEDDKIWFELLQKKPLLEQFFSLYKSPKDLSYSMATGQPTIGLGSFYFDREQLKKAIEIYLQWHEISLRQSSNIASSDVNGVLLHDLHTSNVRDLAVKNGRSVCIVTPNGTALPTTVPPTKKQLEILLERINTIHTQPALPPLQPPLPRK